MSKHEHHSETRGETAPGTYKTYIIGFVLSLILTMTAYLLVLHHVNTKHLVFSHAFLTAVIIALAIVQLFVQLFFFLHLGKESKPRWNLTVLLFALIVVFILVAGSIWIMNNLNYHMLSPNDTDQSIIHDEGIQH